MPWHAVGRTRPACPPRAPAPFPAADPRPLELPLGSVVEWASPKMHAHPLHMHTNPFQLVDLPQDWLQPGCSYSDWFEAGDFQVGGRRRWHRCRHRCCRCCRRRRCSLAGTPPRSVTALPLLAWSRTCSCCRLCGRTPSCEPACSRANTRGAGQGGPVWLAGGG